MGLKGKNAIITGSTKGIGRAIAMALAEQGANIVVVSRHQADCDATAAEIANKYHVSALGVAADLTHRSDIDHMLGRALKHFGRIDILVNNAGSAVTKPAEELTEEDYSKVIDLDMNAVFFCAQAVGKRMIDQGGGVIINVASILGKIAMKCVLPYLMAKGGVIQLTKGLAVEWARYHIRVNALCPGYVMTEINHEQLSDERISGELRKRTAMNRFGTVDEVARAAIFLASDASSYMTGTELIVDGGWTAQ